MNPAGVRHTSSGAASTSSMKTLNSASRPITGISSSVV